MRIALAALLALTIVGCAATPRIETHASGTGIPAGGRYLWFVPEGEPPHLPEASRARLALALAGHGLNSVQPGETPDYLLMVTASRRPARVGLAAPAVAPSGSGQPPAWIDAPAGRGGQLSSLALQFLDPKTGRAVGTVSARALHGRRDAAAMHDRLIQGIMGE